MIDGGRSLQGIGGPGAAAMPAWSDAQSDAMRGSETQLRADRVRDATGQQTALPDPRIPVSRHEAEHDRQIFPLH